MQGRVNNHGIQLHDNKIYVQVQVSLDGGPAAPGGNMTFSVPKGEESPYPVGEQVQVSVTLSQGQSQAKK